MISIITVAFGLLTVAFLWRRQRPAFIAGFIILFGLSYRMVDILYLDLAGPIYAIELDRHIGGNGAAPMFVIAALCFIVPLSRLVSTKGILSGIEAPVGTSSYLDGLQQLVLLGSTLFLSALYFDMLRLGIIPLFVGMDRLEYETISGLLHNISYDMNFLISSTFGVFTVLPRLMGQRYSISFAFLLIAFLMYWALTGNRFSAFFVTLSYYAIPFGTVIAMRAKGILRNTVMRDAWSALISTKVMLPVTFVTGSLAVAGLLVNSYYEVRGYADPMFQIGQRIFVQPVQLWSATWQSLQEGTIGSRLNSAALDYVLLDPVADSNTTIRYLMEKELGFFRTQELIVLGQQYAGGYPEIFFEMFGYWLAVPLMFLLGIGAATILRLALRFLAKGYVLSSIMAIYLFFGFMVSYVGGMLNFLFVPTYWVKILLLVIIASVETKILHHKGDRNGVHTMKAMLRLRTFNRRQP